MDGLRVVHACWHAPFIEWLSPKLAVGNLLTRDLLLDATTEPHGAVAHVRQTIAAGQRVLVHCRGGLGRAGTVAACLLVEHGVTPTQAIERIRLVRPHAIETPAQARYVLNYHPTTSRHELKC
ncbi:protein-tyrosine phosphatase family protein [Variovorax humicola]|uniref:Protein-tyrosine phosphatase family protein n=1 Tax=Variovorax humicola TaxID=1769758 RepID=A0ABU8WAN7_9BURK